MNDMEKAASAAADGGGEPRTWLVPPSSTIKLAAGEGHLLNGATITAWSA